VVVIDVKSPTITTRLVGAADCAHPALRFEHGIELFRRYTVDAFQRRTALSS
jgi:hypothetical protein